MRKEVIHFSHANGFPGSSYRTLFSFLQDQYQIDYIDILGHNPKFPIKDNWSSQTKELIEELDHKKQGPIIGMGHSLGGAITLFAAIERPDLFKFIILLDTPIFSLTRALMLQLFKSLGKVSWITPGGRVKRRRTEWHSIEEVIQYFKTRPLFKNFTEECLKDYAIFGTIQTENGLRLKFDPEIESQIYLTLPHHYSELKHKLTLPCVSIIGKESSVVTKQDVKSMKKNFHMECKFIEGGHLFPFEHPKETAAMIKASIEELLPYIR